MEQVTCEVDGKNLVFELPDADVSRDSLFVFGVHKSGSTLMNNMVRKLCIRAEMPVVDIPTAFFRAGVAIDRTENAMKVVPYLRRKGYAYLGARTFWCRDLGFEFAGLKKILLVRDPRDAIISWYFSDRVSHAIPKGHDKFTALRESLSEGPGVNEQIDYLLSRARSLAGLAERYRQLLEDPYTAVYRYEDVVFRKRLWLRDINSFLELGIDEMTVREIADSHDVIPTEENSSRFIRQVSPGNHSKHFSQEIIDMLDEILIDFLQMFRYDRIDRFEP